MPHPTWSFVGGADKSTNQKIISVSDTSILAIIDKMVGLCSCPTTSHPFRESGTHDILSVYSGNSGRIGTYLTISKWAAQRFPFGNLGRG